MNVTAVEVADRLHAGVRAGGILEKTLYYRVQRDCLAASANVQPLCRTVLLRCASMAASIGESLEDEAIAADYLLLWRRYAAELETAIRLADSSLEANEVLDRLDECERVIIPPRSGLP